MADLPISGLPSASSLDGTELLPFVQGGVTTKATAQDILNADLSITSSGITLSGDIVPTTPQGATLGSVDKPFAELFIQSGSISIESDIPGDPSAVISNENGNLEISVGGMLLIQPDASFIAPTGSFSYLSGSFNHIGSATRFGDTIITGSIDITGSFESDLQENYVWLGDSNNRSTPTTIDQLASSGSLVKSAYISLYHTSSQSLITSGSEQVVTFSNSWGQSGMSLVSGSRLVMENQGTYQFSFVAQVTNSDNAVHDAYFWIKYNGSNFPNSTTRMTLPTRKDSGDASAQLMSINIVGQNVVDNGYIELWWTGDSTTLSLEETPAFGPVPETPSIIANIIRVG
jgi:hypothetical protein